MKRRLLIFVVAFLSEVLTAQVPQGFNYQAIARDGLNNVIANQLLPVRITIQTSLTGGTVIWEETHSVTTTDLGIISLVIGEGENTGGTALSFSEINWGAQPLFIKTEIDPGTGYADMGTSQLWSVPYSMVAGNINDTLQKLVVKGETEDMEEALFEVKNTGGQTVFAVYNEGVRIYIDDGDAKGKKGGFAIGGFGSSKAPGEEYLRVTRDSTRVYLNDTGTKGKKGGFAIGGFGATKGKPVDYMVVRPDSTNFYVRSLTPDTSSTFNILGVNMDLAQTSLLNANVDTINVFGVMNLQNNLIVNGDIEVAGTISQDSQKAILFSSNESGNLDIWKINIDSTNKIQLTTDPSTDYSPQWSPDGSKIVFISDRNGDPKMWIMKSDGTDQSELIASDPGYSHEGPSWSKDGNFIYYSKGISGTGCSPCPTYEIWRVNSDGTNPLQLTDDSYRDNSPFLSPDGQKIAFVKGEYSNDCCNETDVCVMDSDGNNMQKIAEISGYYDWITGGWSPDGSKVLYIVNTTGFYDLYVMNSDGGNKILLATNVGMACFSAFGSKILYIKKDEAGGADIWIMDSDGSNQRAVFMTSFIEDYIDWN